MTDPEISRFEALEARVAGLEADIATLRAEPASGVIPAPPPPPRPESLIRATPLPPPSPSAPRTTEASGPGLLVESETVLKWAGVGLVVLAVGFVVSTGISRGWIGPELQLGGAVGLSAGLIVAGFRLRSTRLPWAHALCSGGVAALFTTFASNLFIDQTTADTASAFVVGVVLVGYVVSRLVPSEWVGVVALSGGLIAWRVIIDGDLPFASTLGFVVAAAVVSIALSIERGWFGLRLLGHVAALVTILVLAENADTGPAQVALVASAVVVVLSLIRVPSIGESDSIWLQLERQASAVAAPWGLAVLMGGFELEGDGEIGVAALAIAGVIAGLALFPASVIPRVRRVHLVSLLLGVSVTVTIGLAALLDTDAVFLAIAVQGAGLVYIDRRFGSSVRVLINAAVLLFVATMFVLVGMLDAWDENVAVGLDIVHLAVIAVIALAVWETGHHLVRQWGASVVLALLLIWLGSVLVHAPEGQAAVSVSWAVVGTGLLLVGAIRKVPDLGAAGLAVLGLTVGKLLLVDMQEVDTLWRAGLFLLVGLGLMRLGFLLPRLTGTSEAPEPSPVR